MDNTPSPSTNFSVFECSRLGFVINISLFFPLDANRETGTSNSRTKLVQVHDSVIVKGNTFLDVVEFEIETDGLWKEDNTRYFWAKNIGLVKKVRYYLLDKRYLEGWYLIDYYVTRVLHLST